MSWSDITDMLDSRAQEFLHGRRLMLNDQNQYFRMGVSDGVQIVGFTPDMKVVAITETKSDGETYVHLPSGTVEKDEHFVLAAGREFAEETGYRFERLVRLVTAKQSSLHLIGDDITFVALGCVKDPDCRAKPDKSEKIEKVEELAPEALKRKMQDDLLRDPTKSVSGRNSYASLQLAMAWAKKNGLLNKPVTETSPLLVVIAGLPLSGKTTLGDKLEAMTQIHYGDIDRLRVQAFGVPTVAQMAERWKDPKAGAKAQEQDMRLGYQLLHEGAIQIALTAGRSLIISATYARKPSQEFLKAMADACGARVKIIHCRIFNPTQEELERRMKREGNEVLVSSLNDWSNYLEITERYDSITTTGVFPREQILEVDTGQPLESYIDRVVEFVRS